MPNSTVHLITRFYGTIIATQKKFDTILKVLLSGYRIMPAHVLMALEHLFHGINNMSLNHCQIPPFTWPTIQYPTCCKVV